MLCLSYAAEKHRETQREGNRHTHRHTHTHTHMQRVGWSVWKQAQKSLDPARGCTFVANGISLQSWPRASSNSTWVCRPFSSSSDGQFCNLNSLIFSSLSLSLCLSLLVPISIVSLVILNRNCCITDCRVYQLSFVSLSGNCCGCNSGKIVIMFVGLRFLFQRRFCRGATKRWWWETTAT